MTKDHRKCHAYLLRLWSVEEASDTDSTKTGWRVTLEDVQTHTRQSFADLAQAFVFLQQRIHCSKKDRDETD